MFLGDGFSFQFFVKKELCEFPSQNHDFMHAGRKRLETAVLITYLMSDFVYLLIWWFQGNNSNNENNDKDMFSFTSLTLVS